MKLCASLMFLAAASAGAAIIAAPTQIVAAEPGAASAASERAAPTIRAAAPKRAASQESGAASRSAGAANLEVLKASFDALMTATAMGDYAALDIENGEYAQGLALRFNAEHVRLQGGLPCPIAIGKGGGYASAYFTVSPSAANVNEAHVLSLTFNAAGAGSISIEKIGVVNSATVQFSAGAGVVDVLFRPQSTAPVKVMIRTFQYSDHDLAAYLCLKTAEVHVVK